jgi:two-component system chemotaxis response regulator CheY
MAIFLIVDDSRVIRSVARKIFQDLGIETLEAENGQLALDSIKDVIPDGVLLDWNMPVMNGLEFLQNLRATDLERQPKVILCTTENDMDHIITALNAGADEYIMKPFDADIVRTKLEQIGLL